MMKKVIAVVLVLVMLLSMSACSQSQNQNDNPDTGTPSETEGDDYRFETEHWAAMAEDEMVTWEKPNDYKRVGMIVPDGTSEYYLDYCNKVSDALKEIGYDFVWADALDSESAINTIETWVMQGIDALIVGVLDVGCESAVLDAMRQGVLVMLTSGALSSYHVFVTQDSYKSGYNAGFLAAEAAAKKFGDDASYITIGMNSAEFQTLKTSGMLDAMDENYPNGTRYEIIGSATNSSAATIQDDVETLLTQHPEIKFVVSWNSVLSLYALSACDSLGISDPDEFAIYGSMLSAQAIEELKDADSVYAGDVYVGDMAMKTVDLLIKLLNGEPVPHVERGVDELAVTKDNVDTYLEDYAEIYYN